MSSSKKVEEKIGNMYVLIFYPTLVHFGCFAFWLVALLEIVYKKSRSTTLGITGLQDTKFC